MLALDAAAWRPRPRPWVDRFSGRPRATHAAWMPHSAAVGFADNDTFCCGRPLHATCHRRHRMSLNGDSPVARGVGRNRTSRYRRPTPPPQQIGDGGAKPRRRDRIVVRKARSAKRNTRSETKKRETLRIAGRGQLTKPRRAGERQNPLTAALRERSDRRRVWSLTREPSRTRGPGKGERWTPR